MKNVLKLIAILSFLLIVLAGCPDPNNGSNNDGNNTPTTAGTPSNSGETGNGGSTGNGGTQTSSYAITIGTPTGGSISVSAGGQAVNSGAQVTSGATVTITASPQSGYQLQSITATGADSSNITLNGTGNSRTFTMPAQNVTVSASFLVIPTYTLTINSPTNGSISVSVGGQAVNSGAQVQSGTTVTITASPQSGYQVQSITATGANNSTIALTGTGNSRTFTMPAQNVTVSASFIQVYSITAGSGVTVNKTYAAAGETVTITPNPAPSNTNVCLITVSGSNSTVATLASLGDDRTFTMPAQAVSVSAACYAANTVTVSAGHSDVSVSYLDREITIIIDGSDSILVPSGTIVTLYARTYDDYNQSMSVTANGQNVALTDIGNDYYTFTMPNQNVHITVYGVLP